MAGQTKAVGDRSRQLVLISALERAKMGLLRSSELWSAIQPPDEDFCHEYPVNDSATGRTGSGADADRARRRQPRQQGRSGRGPCRGQAAGRRIRLSTRQVIRSEAAADCGAGAALAPAARPPLLQRRVRLDARGAARGRGVDHERLRGTPDDGDGDPLALDGTATHVTPAGKSSGNPNVREWS